MDDESGSPTGGVTAAPETKHLAPEEVLEKLDSMSANDKRKLRLIERRRRGGTDFQENELYSEAVCQAIVGERRCPRDESFVAFLAQSMRSIASHRRKALGRTVPLTSDDHRPGGGEKQIAADQLDQEALLIEKQAEDVTKVIYDALEDDEEAQLAVIAISGQNRGKALRDEIGVDQAGYDYIMKRIRRTLAKKFPDGFRS
ncbi:sigma-70 family RNA polymerase sigma factor [Bradyrhizobium sp. RT9a]|uniref:sigma-70 family RNA polymerase sigma factor n=1 Tax=Bradyrhizobium sp. RT9a TaxID=3156384 RepID=UPI003394F806